MRWQIKDCLTTEPRTFDSWLLVIVNLIYPLSTVHLRTYLLPSMVCSTSLDMLPSKYQDPMKRQPSTQHTESRIISFASTKSNINEASKRNVALLLPCSRHALRGARAGSLRDTCLCSEGSEAPGAIHLSRPSPCSILSPASGLMLLGFLHSCPF